jgi:mannose-6-phosphate isomerase-like protein (cupin superfamily)
MSGDRAAPAVDYPSVEFDRPTHIPRAAAGRWVWGDEGSGHTADWIYVSSRTISQVVFGIAPGSCFRDSPENRTIYPSDQVYLVLEGVVAFADASTGEVRRVEQGGGAFFHGETWHHAFNFGRGGARILEFSAPPAVAAVEYSRDRTPTATAPKYLRDELVGSWPATGGGGLESSLHVLSPRDLLWSVVGGFGSELLVGLYASTSHLTAGEIHLPPGRRSDLRTHEGESSFFVLEGSVHLQVERDGGIDWMELEPEDGAYLPAGTSYRLLNFTAEPAVVLFQIVPGETSA